MFGAVAAGTLAYALVPHKQTLMLDSRAQCLIFHQQKLFTDFDLLSVLIARRTRSAWEDPPAKEAEPVAEESSPSSESHGGEIDASNSAAYDPVTGEINWDCSCLGGMAHGPCGPEFREAFSCFIYSEDEPKGINCVEKFKGMQDCFRAHPEVYGEGTVTSLVYKSRLTNSARNFLLMFS